MKINFNCVNTQNNIPAKITNKTPHFGNNNASEDKIDIFGSILNNVVNALTKLKHETNVENYIAVLSDKKLRMQLNQYKSKQIEDLNYIILPNNFSMQDFLNKLFKDAGINKVLHLSNFIRIYTQNPNTTKTFRGQNIEAVKIFGYLENKFDINSFPNLLLYLFNQEDNEKNPDFNKLNTYTDTLKKLGIKQESEIEEKLSYLKPEFNNFESESDKINAIKYLQETYNAKITLLNEILQKSSKNSKQDCEQVYSKLGDVINYLYIKNDGQSLDKLADYIDLALEFGKIKPQAKNQLNTSFEDIDKPECKISFFEFIKECGVSINDINTYTKRTFISDSDLLDIIIYKNPICNQIKNNQPQTVYNNFYTLLTAVYAKGENNEDTEAVDTLLSITEQNKIKDQNAFLSFYNKVCKTNEKSLTIKQICEFVDLYRYSDKKDITDIDILKQNKLKFDNALPFIENFLRNDASDYFIGKSPLEIYKEFSYCVDFSSEEKIKTLNELAVFHQNNSEQTKLSQESFNNFRQYFKSKQSALDFIIQNNITFDGSQESEEYKNGCIEILKILSGEPEKAEERIDKLTKTKFLVKSKSNLNEFITKYKKTNQLNQLINIIIDKEVPSVRNLNTFLKQYENSLAEQDNIIKHLSSIPDDMNFVSYKNLLDTLNDMLKHYQIPRNIDNDNILNIDIDKYRTRKIKSAEELNNLFCLILNKKCNTSFIEGLKYTYKDNNEIYSPYRIAKELVNKIGQTNESYQNIVRELKLDKESLNIPQVCDDNTYIYAVKQNLPQEFIEFVNSSKWLNINNDNRLANLTLHAKLRLIDRTILTEQGSVNTLYKDSTKEKLKDILKSIYTQTPTKIKGREDSHRIVIQTPYGSRKMESVFNNKGEMITVIPVD